MKIPKKRGFATMTIEQRQEIAAMGGRAVPADKRSFAQDKPYDRFVREQLAGDLLPARDDRERAELQVATGFLALGPKSHNERVALQFARERSLVDFRINLSRSRIPAPLRLRRFLPRQIDPET